MFSVSSLILILMEYMTKHVLTIARDRSTKLYPWSLWRKRIIIPWSLTHPFRIQLIMHFCLIFWFFFLIWKTFLFRFGLLGRLMKREFPILLVVPFNFLLFLAETGIRVVWLWCLIYWYSIAFWLLTLRWTSWLCIRVGTTKLYSGPDTLVSWKFYLIEMYSNCHRICWCCQGCYLHRTPILLQASQVDSKLMHTVYK